MEMYKVFYLDDEKNDLVLPIKEKLESTGKLSVTWEKPATFEDELLVIEKLLQDHHCVLLDLQLDEKQEDGTQVRYQAPTLAQQIRTLGSEKRIPECPIILCSTADKVKISFNRDFTSHNLFDWTFMKSDINTETVGKIISVIEAYSTVSKSKKDFSDLLKRNYHDIDERILSRFVNEDDPPVHEICRTILNEIVQVRGVLIEEDVLAARLGIDIEKSKGWEDIKSQLFEEAKYSGIFSSSWQRWWADKVFDIFEQKTKANLASLEARERVDLLQEHVKEPIVASAPLKFCQSTNFWTVCQVTRKAIDPFEAFKIDMKEEPKPWQDYQYVSLYALLERLAEQEGIVIHPSEMDRFRVESESCDS